VFQDDDFKSWLAAVVDDPFRAKCKACDSKFTAGLSDIKRHSESAAHKKRMLTFRKQQYLSSWVRPSSTSTSEKDELDTKVKFTEIKLASYFCEHNIPMKSIDHLSELLKEIFPDSEIANNVKMHRTKCTSIVTNVLGKRETASLSSELKNNKFSLLIDEGTEIAQTKLIACVVKYFSEVQSDVTQLLEVISHAVRDCSSESVASAIRKFLEEKGISLNNIIGMAADNASIMVGEHNSVMSKLRQEADRSFIILKCICHCMHIAASKSAAKISTNVEAFVRNISCYFWA